jgi:predicted nucleotidyltransferase
MAKEKQDPVEIKGGEYALLRSFYPKVDDLTIKEIMKKTSYSSYERNNSYLKSLAKKRVIQEKKVGRTLVYSLIPNNWFSKNAFNFYALDRARVFSEKYKLISTALKELPEEDIDFYAIFGSYAKGTQRKESDIDLLCITSKKNKIETAIAAIKRKYNLDIQAVIIPKIEFAKIKNENPGFWQDLVNYGIIFKGYELFYYYAYGKSKKE